MEVPEATTFPSREDTSQVRLLHDLAKIHATLDDPDSVSRAGLAPVMALPAGRARRCTQLSMCRSPGRTRSMPTLGSFLRSFTWGNVLQLGKVHRLVLAGLARLAPLLPGRQTLAFIDSQQKRVYGRKKQGAALGHTKIQGKSLLVRGLNARWPPRSARRWAHRPSRPPGRAVATPLRARGAASFAMVLLRQVFTLTCVSPRTAGDGHPHSPPAVPARSARRCGTARADAPGRRC